MSVEYAIIVKNKTRLEALIERFNTQAQAKFYIERSGGNFQDYVIEHDVFCTAFAQIQQRLSSVIKNKVVDRSFTFKTSPQDIQQQTTFVVSSVKEAVGIVEEK